MKHLSLERRRVVALGGTTAAFSGVGSLLHNTHPHWALAWIVAEVVLSVMTIVLFVRLRNKPHGNDCSKA